MTLTMDRYPAASLALAESRGWDRAAHAAALAEDTDGCGSSDDIILTHPTNWLSEAEVEADWTAPGCVYPDGSGWTDPEDER